MIAIYPGSFDPPTHGHFDIIRRGAAIFKKLYIAIAVNAEKKPLFTEAERKTMLERGLHGVRNAKVVVFHGLVADFARETGAAAILRGVRSVADYEYELQMANANRNLSGGHIETLLLLPSVQHSFISSRLVREAAMLGGDVSQFVPAHVHAMLRKKFRKPS